jgi:CheY-like chemotaxis protein
MVIVVPTFAHGEDSQQPIVSRVGSEGMTGTARAVVVLVVEDEFLVRCSVADHLRNAGYAVLETASGEEAITFCKSEMTIDILFTDINLAGPTSGWDVAECFRTDRPNGPVLYASGKSFDTQRRVHGSVFVPKPYTNTDILEACKRLNIK